MSEAATAGETIATQYLIIGGAGFIGSHFADHLLSDANTAQVTVYDNLSSGHAWHLDRHASDARLRLVTADVHDRERLLLAMPGHDVVIHLAANPDISRAANDPDVDFDDGTVLTRNVLEAMRETGVPRILYASGSGVYGDRGDSEVAEDLGNMRPISTYGASKLACEALISAYTHMFGLSGLCFRFANVVGPRQTHGVGYDFLRKLSADPTRLDILGDGRQSKSYLHVDDTVAAVMLAHRNCAIPFDVFNVATGDAISVRDIAELAVACMGLADGSVDYVFSGGDRGWKGDIPVVRLNADRIKALGWRCRHSSRVAIERSLAALREDLAREAD